MRLEWLEDILAVAETGSFQAAAERRRLTQPAFSRRLRAIEESLGVALFDRSSKPARVLPHALEEVERMRDLAAGLRELSARLRERDRTRRNRLVIACQHAITTSTAPALIERLSGLDLDIRLRSANRDECLAHLMTRHADVALFYDVEGGAPIAGADFLTLADIGVETLTPVFAAGTVDALNEAYGRGELPVVGYPKDVFLGAVQRRLILPRLGHAGALRTRLETALTLAALQCARSGIGVAWVPRSLAMDDLARGALVDLGGSLPVVEMRLVAARARGAAPPAVAAAWPEIVGSQDAAAASLVRSAAPGSVSPSP
ncbi:LysR family transcriptional regulator [Salinarimonas sp.]|uniref:LysR family transcriptional regulator n=1 Tax=Salinarimonas sp. TaxID=2766526 RepID=UPI0032D8FA0F